MDGRSIEFLRTVSSDETLDLSRSFTDDADAEPRRAPLVFGRTRGLSSSNLSSGAAAAPPFPRDSSWMRVAVASPVGEPERWLGRACGFGNSRPREADWREETGLSHNKHLDRKPAVTFFPVNGQFVPLTV